jgi:gliding motility-associated-like protein
MVCYSGGNAPINDICVNGTASNIVNVSNGCEDGVWVVINDVPYLLNPDYLKYFDQNQKANAMYADHLLTDPVTNINLCKESALTLHLNGEFSVPDQSICSYTHQIVTLNAPPGFSKYTWNGQPGNQTYPVDRFQTVNLTVTDANGCQTTKQINVTEQCADVHILNTFTPNGDGINDTWNISGLEYDQTASVTIFNRYGQQVFESKGYGTPWNREDGGRRLPAGSYYYMITAKNNQKKLSGGYVTLIY